VLVACLELRRHGLPRRVGVAFSPARPLGPPRSLHTGATRHRGRRRPPRASARGRSSPSRVAAV